MNSLKHITLSVSFAITSTMLFAQTKGEPTGSDNVLSTSEKSEGWKLLFDGKTGNGWRSAGRGKTTFPVKGWLIENGTITVLPSEGKESQNGGDIVTNEEYGSFDLVFDFKLTPNGNSGVKYLVTEAYKTTGSAIGIEYQVFDDKGTSTSEVISRGHENKSLASAYELFAASASKKPNPLGQWNTGRVLMRGNHIEHWLNGQKVLEYERGSKAFHDAVAASKFAKFPGFGEAEKGHILLQDHGTRVSFKNIKLRDFSKQ